MLKNINPNLISSGLILTFVLLIAGLFLPVMRIEKLVFWEDRYSIVVGTFNLLSGGQIFLGLIILMFSIVFPIVKIIAIGCIWFGNVSKPDAKKIVHWVTWLGKWSMLDVFVVAIIVVLSGSRALGETSPGPGLYVFSIAIFCSMIVTEIVGKRLKNEK